MPSFCRRRSKRRVIASGVSFVTRASSARDWSSAREDGGRARAAIQARNEAYANRLGKRFGLTIEFVEDAPFEGKYENGVITLPRETTQAGIFHRVLFHEATHAIEGTEEYGQFSDLMTSMSYGTTFRQMDEHRTAGEMTLADQRLRYHIFMVPTPQSGAWHPGVAGIMPQKGMTRDVRARYQARGVLLSEEEALREVVADRAFKMFDGDQATLVPTPQRGVRHPGAAGIMPQRGMTMIDAFVAQSPSLARRVLDAIQSFLAKLTGHGDPTLTETQKRLVLARDVFQSALEHRESRTGEGAQYAIVLDDSNVPIVKADRNFVLGEDPKQWRGNATKYIRDHIRKGQDVLFKTVEGKNILLTGDTQWHLRSMDKKTKGQLYEVKQKAAVHIDEVIEVARDVDPSAENATDDGRHTKLAKNGWRYYESVFEDEDGQRYLITLSVGQAEGETAYNIGKIQKINRPATVMRSPAGRVPAGHAAGTSADIVSQGDSSYNSEKSVAHSGAGNNPAQENRQGAQLSIPDEDSLRQTIRAQAQRDVARLFEQDDAQRLEASYQAQIMANARIGMHGERAERKSLSEAREAFAAKYLDDTRSAFKLTQATMARNEAEGRKPGEYDPAKDVRDMILAGRNMKYNFAQESMKYGLTSLSGQRMTRADGTEYGAFEDLTRNTVKRTEEIEWSQYLLDRHAIDRHRAGTPIHQDDPAEVVFKRIADAEARHPQWRETSEKVYEWYDAFFREYRVRTGIVSEQLYARWREMYPHYVPVMRVMDKNERPASLQGIAPQRIRAAQQARITGSDGKVQPPMTSMALMIQQYTADAMQAQIHQAMDAQLREINAEGLGLARELPPLTLRNDRTIENGAILNLDRFEWGLVDEDGNSVIQVPTRHGIRRWIVNDNGVVDAILKTQARTPSEMGNVIHTLARFVGLFSRMMTQYSLKFSGQNFLSDGATAMNTGSHAGTIHSLSFLYNAERLATAFGLLGEKISEARGQEVSEAYRDFRLFGQMGSPYTTRSDASIEELRQSLYSKGDTLGERSAALVAHWKEIGTVKALAEAMANSVGLPVKALFHGVGAISEFGEEVTRYHEYKGAAKARAGENKTAQEAYSDKIAAGKAARESTTDFSKHGNSELVQFYGALVPFARAQMEGVYKGIRLFSEENKGKRLAIGGTIIVNTLISKIVLSTLRDLMWNDEEKEAYEEMSAYERTKYEHIKLPGIGIVRLKRAQDPNVQFASALGEFLADSTTGFEGSDVANLVAMAREIAMGMVPSKDTIFDPWFDTLNNRTWYGGQIESARMQKLAKADRYKEDTPGLFRALGKMGGLSPLQWEQAFLSYTGSMGTIGVNTLKKGIHYLLEIGPLKTDEMEKRPFTMIGARTTICKTPHSARIASYLDAFKTEETKGIIRITL